MPDNVEIGTIVEGKVVKIKPFGAIVALPSSSHGLVHISHISSDFVQDINDYLTVGDKVLVKVISVDSDKSKISLSIKDAVDKEKPAPVPERPSRPSASAEGSSLEDKIKDFIKHSNERQATLNKRNKKR